MSCAKVAIWQVPHPTDFMEDDDDDTLALPGFVKEQDNP
jgi:hypothetical protein